jgi:hypothetical protein
MPDPVGTQLASISGVIAAIAALGTAGYGLVDTTKVFWGGVSNAGFGYITSALAPFAPALQAAGGATWKFTLRAHWINGMSKDDQKAIAKSLIHLGLSSDNARLIALPARVDATALLTAATNVDTGVALTPADINVLGRMDAMIEATLDGGFERADQLYRNASKALAALFAIILACAGEYVIQEASHSAAPGGYLLAILVGIVAVPLAPVAKDLSSALAVAVKAMKEA